MTRCKYRPAPILCRLAFKIKGATRHFTIPGLSGLFLLATASSYDFYINTRLKFFIFFLLSNPLKKYSSLNILLQGGGLAPPPEAHLNNFHI